LHHAGVLREDIRADAAASLSMLGALLETIFRGQGR
jgi:hypothetical protein